MMTTRFIPHQSNGRVESIKVYAIRRNSPLAILGFRNGDGIRRVNGLDITSPEAALQAYSTLRSATDFRIELDRRGQSITLRYRIVETLPAP